MKHPQYPLVVHIAGVHLVWSCVSERRCLTRLKVFAFVSRMFKDVVGGVMLMRALKQTIESRLLTSDNNDQGGDYKLLKSDGGRVVSIVQDRNVNSFVVDVVVVAW